jgi:hypothetical protein
MENQFDISSYKYTGPELDNESVNSDISFSKIEEVINSLDKAAKAIIIPILKIKKKISMKFDVFAKDYSEIKDKAKLASKEINTHQEESKSDSMNITDIQLNQKYAINHENMIIFFENITNNIELFSKLFNSNEYDNLIKGFDELIKDSEKNELFSQEEKLKEKEEISKITRDNIKLKKPKRPPPHNNGVNRKALKRLGPSSVTKKKRQRIKKIKIKDVDLLSILQKNFPSNSYVRRISKTFISRRLFKKVIYRHVFEYKKDGKIEDNKLRSAGESTIYKYGKFIFKFYNDVINNTDKIDEVLGKEMKQQFAKLDEENNEYIIGGKIGCSHFELISKIFRKNLYNEFSVVQVIVEFYEFYEELVSEFNEKEENVRIIFCDEKILNNLRDDWKNLEMVRNYIKQIKDSEK